MSFPDEATIAPVRVRVGDPRDGRIERRATGLDVVAEAELGPAADLSFATGGGYDGPLATRQGERMRPDVALAFDRMDAAARADGITLAINSGYRSDAEQAVLWARNPDPKMVARPGTSLHRNGTELDLGPPSAYAWLAANAPRFHFIQRYAWEDWHYGYTLNAGSSPRAAPAAGDAAGEPRRQRSTASGAGEGGDGEAACRTAPCPGSCPPRFAPMLRAAAMRWNVSAKLLAAQIYAESSFNPFAVPKPARRGSRSSCPGPRGGWGWTTRSTPSRRSTRRRT